MFPYIIMFAHFVISSVVVFFAYKALVNIDNIKINMQQSVIASLALTIPTFIVSLVAPGIGWVVIGGILLLFIQKSYIKDTKKSALLVLKIAAILVLVISIILLVSGMIL